MAGEREVAMMRVSVRATATARVRQNVKRMGFSE